MPNPPSKTWSHTARALLDPARVMPLGPGSPQRDRYEELRALRPELLFEGGTVRRRAAAECCLAALWLRYDFLDEAHTIVQAIDEPAGSFGHALMHRREGDFSNSKYWLRRAGVQPIFAGLAEFVGQLGLPTELVARLAPAGAWDADGFVDLCAAAVKQRSPADSAEAVAWLEQIQHREWEAYLEECRRQAVGEG
ncbi:MAG: hypothetical protein JNG90_16605 [Planctomycetaceae bacterium]|nr:hypothetical protein [Planctomycetaceae bacterium]